jgi:hypothetical protein
MVIKPLFSSWGVNPSFVFPFLRLIRVNSYEVRNRNAFELLAIAFFLGLVVFKVEAVTHETKFLFELVVIGLVDSTVISQIRIQTLTYLNLGDAYCSKTFVIHASYQRNSQSEASVWLRPKKKSIKHNIKGKHLLPKLFPP